ncbi:MAG: hypothetical protein RI909_221 [Bacteroidota bacterium]
MKHYLIGVIAAMMITGTAMAQHNNFGIKGGLNAYNVYSDDNSSADTKMGYHFGLISHIHLGNQFAIQPELIYSTQGSQYTIGSTTAKLNLNYVNVPLLFQYMFDNGFRLMAGPQLGFLVSAKTEIDNTKTDVKDNLKKMEVAFGIGASYVHPPSGFGVDARYNFGLTNINDVGSVNSYNRGLQVGVFYLFKHGS